MKKILILLLMPFSAFAQCPFTPVINGNTMLCPNDSAVLTTQQFDSYQWYQRPIGGTSQLLPGATMQTFNIDYFNNAGYYYSVEVTENGCTEMSAEVLVDGYAFLPPFVMTDGEFTIGPNGETVVCIGDTAWFTLMQPYDTNITWFFNGTAIPGASAPTIYITATGQYNVQGAPSVCPDYIQQLGVVLDAQLINCSVGLEEEIAITPVIYPNPASGSINLELATDNDYTIHDAAGRKLKQISPGSGLIDVSDLAPGIYYLQSGSKAVKFIIN